VVISVFIPFACGCLISRNPVYAERAAKALLPANSTEERRWYSAKCCFNIFRGLCRQFCCGICSLMFSLVVLAVIIGTYFVIGYVDMPYTVYTSDSVATNETQAWTNLDNAYVCYTTLYRH